MRGGGIGGFLPISIYFIRGSLVLLVLQCSILQLYLHTKGDNSLKIPLSFVAGLSLNLKLIYL